MQGFKAQLLVATALTAAVLIAAPMAALHAVENATVPTNPGFKPAEGQINPGETKQAPSAAPEKQPVPTPQEALAALRMPVSTQPSLGASDGPALPKAEAPMQSGASSEQLESKNAAGGPQGSGANVNTPDHAKEAYGMKPGAATNTPSGQATTGAGGATQMQGANSPQASNEPAPSGPIGAVGQTMPAKFSERNATLDRLPIMAWPMKLDDAQRQRIFQAVMAEKSAPATEADALKPASELSTAQALNGLHPLPESLKDIADVRGLKYVKAKDKVFLVEPSTRIVVDQIES